MSFFFFNDTATTEIYTLSLHDALPICELLKTLRGDIDRHRGRRFARRRTVLVRPRHMRGLQSARGGGRSEEHTSELQSRQYLVCRLLLEKKKNTTSLTSVLSGSYYLGC